ncbi:MAG TPA: cobalamin-independent methionine synthase II family protein [Alphaproteobacteria bacterium]
MKRSTDRILTTHTGSLPRPDGLVELFRVQEGGGAIDRAAFAGQVRAAVADVVHRQRAAGIDVVNDGEQGKPDYSTYIKDRLTGFEGERTPATVSREARQFPELYAKGMPIANLFVTRPMCVGPIAWKDFAAVERDIANLKAAVAGAGADEAFMTAVSPGQAARFLGNRHYRTHEEYLHALAAVLKDEYDAIHQAGFVLQLDCPDLASGWNSQFTELTVAEFRKIVALHLEVLDAATRDIPPEQIRLHLCWGNYAGPHTCDIPLKDIIDLVLKSRPAAISFEGANPRHEHEWRLFEEMRLPDGKLLMPGVLDSTCNFVEHPELVAERICRYAAVAGRENVIAGTDCGFATFVGRDGVHPTVVWAKLAAMAEGARLASMRLWR